MTDINTNRNTIAIALARAIAAAVKPMQPVNGVVSLQHDVSVTVDGVVWQVGLLGAVAVDVRKADPADKT